MPESSDRDDGNGAGGGGGVRLLRQASAEYRRLASAAADPLERDAYRELATVLDIALRRLGLSR